MDDMTLVERIAFWFLPVIFAITLHEVAHGWVASKLGDYTAKRLGRLSLNPIRHVDPIGTIAVPGVLVMLTGFVFGWAKPVPVHWDNLHKPKRDMALVALAGPMANLAMALIWVLIIKLGVPFLQTDLHWLAVACIYMGIAGIFINVILMTLNLLPLPPLDGGRILVGILPGPWAWRVAKLEPYGLIVLLALMLAGILGKILWPIVLIVQTILSILAGLHPATFMSALSNLMGQ